MTNVTFAVPEELHQIMRKHNEIKWSEIARQAMWDRAKKMEIMDRILSKSNLTEKDAEEIGRKIKSEIAKKHNLR